jgi:hypothetical protein
VTARNFVEALWNLDVALRAPDVLAPGEKIVVEIPYEAGKRLELWLMNNPPEELVYRQQWCRTIDVDSEAPKRECELHGVKVRWPVERELSNDGMRPRPACGPMDRRVPRYEG